MGSVPHIYTKRLADARLPAAEMQVPSGAQAAGSGIGALPTLCISGPMGPLPHAVGLESSRAIPLARQPGEGR